MSSNVTRALTTLAALCGIAFARPATVHAPTGARPGPARLLLGLEVPTDRYLDLGVARPSADAPAGYVPAPAPWQVEPARAAAPVPDREARYVDVGALGLVRRTTDPPAR